VIVVFDGVCNLCNGWVRFICRRDRRGAVRFASIQSAAGQALLAQHGYRVEGLDTLLVIDGGRVHVKTEAIRRVLVPLGPPWSWAAAMLGLVPVRARDWLYTRIAVNRYALFGRRPSCPMPTPDLAARLLPEGDIPRD
jgi:predicted DCC family thiol-disulfide oxidoreductase YuxK